MDRRRSSHIVPEIYEATIDPNHWDYVVSMIAKLTRSKSACLYYKNKEMDFASTIAQFGFPPEQRSSLGDQCDSLDLMFCSRGGSAAGEPACTQFHPGSNGVMPEDSELYHTWMKPNGVYHVGGAQFVDTDTHKAGIAILRDEAAGGWSEGEVRVINEILPHLRRALNIHSEFTHLRLKQDALPGHTIPVWFRAELRPEDVERGESSYDLVCAELCGWGHYKMAGSVRVMRRDLFDAWMAEAEARWFSNGTEDAQ